MIQEKLSWEQCFISLWTGYRLLKDKTMTTVAPYKTCHCIFLSSRREVPGRRGWLASTLKVPFNQGPSNLKNYFALWVPVLSVEPTVSSFFRLKNSGSQTFSMHPNSPKGLLNHRCPVSDSLHSAICISSQLPGEAIAAAALGTTG